MLCLFGLAGTIIMGFLGREAWQDSRAWRGLFQWQTGPYPGNAWSGPAAAHCARNESPACQTCAVRPLRLQS